MVIRFAGDSGDGMQLTGTEFTRMAALYGNDIATFPDFPAEIRAPAGSLAGVSGFQLQFSSNEIFTAGDAPEVLVAMNPAALRTNLPDLEPGGLLILNVGAFKAKNLELAGYEKNPLEDGSLAKYRLIPVDFGKHTSTALAGTGMSSRDIARTQNFF
ncbi:MAG TPA: 2-oxoacid:acceptor oxidoreductase family protein, partial [Myxococcota bacterium]|nr:2-oxoacid:acceptor oxidoreductase family protein [Myxococcota bacterium]